jgi:hypothetical protein
LHWFFFFFFAQNFWIIWIFLHAPSFVRALLMIEKFLLCPPSIVWALSVVEVFSMFSHLPPSVGCDPSQGYFQKTLPGSKGDCKGYISAL